MLGSGSCPFFNALLHIAFPWPEIVNSKPNVFWSLKSQIPGPTCMGKKPVGFSLLKSSGLKRRPCHSRVSAKARAPHVALAAMEMVLSAFLN